MSAWLLDLARVAVVTVVMAASFELWGWVSIWIYARARERREREG